jgi:hypothetical protein
MNNMNNAPGKSEENFVSAILTQAIEDARYDGTNKKYLKHKIEAINWILSDDPQFQEYCKLISIEPKWVKNKMVGNNDYKISRKQKVLLKPIVKTLLKSKTYNMPEVMYG